MRMTLCVIYSDLLHATPPYLTEPRYSATCEVILRLRKSGVTTVSKEYTHHEISNNIQPISYSGEASVSVETER